MEIQLENGPYRAHKPASGMRLKRKMLPNQTLEPTLDGALHSAFAVDITGPAWLSFGRW
jgi:hypothetical protein